MKLLEGLIQKMRENIRKAAHSTIINSFGIKHSIQSSTITEFSIPNSLAERFVKLDLVYSLKLPQLFKKQRVIPVKSFKEIKEETNDDTLIDSDEFDYIPEYHSISRNRISLRGIGRVRGNRIVKVKPKTGYEKMKDPAVESGLLDVHYVILKTLISVFF
ncbi:hypothetical protein HNY73_010343 [Argiope bruennichi]|uniref:Uncharacterized protein n=1 Tax=Argiope bruennichi TaxID=94029 RepID=A0A8T0F338_ARGBR|nr:hypothetical protein HNY73_010343 [Argiope bruennichi]